MSSTCEMSVVVVTDRAATIAKLMSHLRAQTIADRLEIVIVTPAPDDPGLAPMLEGFAARRVRAVEGLPSLSWLRVPGIEAASAPFVGLIESHSFPEPRWAEALLGALRDDWDGVGPAVTNANPVSRLGWASFLTDYGKWAAPHARAEIDDLPGHNSAYRRDVLLSFGADLRPMMEAETALHTAMRADGRRLCVEPAAITNHLNVSRFASWIRERYHTGRRFAAARAHRWPLWRRIVYGGGSWLIPLVRLPRVLRDARRIGARRSVRWFMPALAGALICSSFGEMLGYLGGSGASMRELSKMELNKWPHLGRRERRAEATA